MEKTPTVTACTVVVHGVNLTVQKQQLYKYR